MNVCIDGLRRQIAENAKDLKSELSDIDKCYRECTSVEDSFNDLAQNINMLLCIFDNDNKDDFNEIIDSVGAIVPFEDD